VASHAAVRAGVRPLTHCAPRLGNFRFDVHELRTLDAPHRYDHFRYASLVPPEEDYAVDWWAGAVASAGRKRPRTRPAAGGGVAATSDAIFGLVTPERKRLRGHVTPLFLKSCARQWWRAKVLASQRTTISARQRKWFRWEVCLRLYGGRCRSDQPVCRCIAGDDAGIDLYRAADLVRA
jgi:hypothetical protein